MNGWEGRSIPDLAEIRKSRGLSVRQIANSTRIWVRYLDAIEEGRFDRLPGGIYDTSYIRQYARAIEFDEEELVRSYRAATLPPVPEPPPARRTGFGNWLIDRFHGLLSVAAPKFH